MSKVYLLMENDEAGYQSWVKAVFASREAAERFRDTMYVPAWGYDKTKPFGRIPLICKDTFKTWPALKIYPRNDGDYWEWKGEKGGTTDPLDIEEFQLRS